MCVSVCQYSTTNVTFSLQNGLQFYKFVLKTYVTFFLPFEAAFFLVAEGMDDPSWKVVFLICSWLNSGCKYMQGHSNQLNSLYQQNLIYTHMLYLLKKFYLRLTHCSSGRGFPLWKLETIKAMVVRVLPWNTAYKFWALVGLILSTKRTSLRSSHQPHVISQNPTKHFLRPLLHCKVSENVKVKAILLLPERGQIVAVFTRGHPWERLLLMWE